MPLQPVLLGKVKVLETKQGKKYVNFEAGDRTGTIPCVYWDYEQLVPEGRAAFVDGNVVQIAGSISLYKDKPQLTVTDVARATDFDMRDLEKSSKYDPSLMFGKFLKYVESFEHDYFKSVAWKIVEEFGDQFRMKPAATGMHHAFKHGLLEHTLQMLETAETVLKLPYYAEELNKDLCMFGIMFHDFGKIFEYGDGPSFQKTVSGIKVPHIPKMGAHIYHTCKLLDIPGPVADEMMSVVLSHHRFMEWGSPCTPSSPEATFVHHIDNLHGDVFGQAQKIADDPSNDDRVKFGYGDQALTLVKKRFSTLLKEMEEKHGQGIQRQAADAQQTSGEESGLDGVRPGNASDDDPF